MKIGVISINTTQHGLILFYICSRRSYTHTRTHTMAPNTQVTERIRNGYKPEDERQLVTRDWLLERAKSDTWNCFEHIVWFNLVWFVGLHVISLYAIYQILSGQTMLLTFLFGRLFWCLVFHFLLTEINFCLNRN